jgi:hypothetical protein
LKIPEALVAHEEEKMPEVMNGKEIPEQNTAEDIEFEIQDDIPEDDKDPITGKEREPMPQELVQELEQDELEDYSDKVKTRLKQMKKVWHDERRAKEAAFRERQAAEEFARKVFEENKKLKETLSSGEKSYIDTAKNAANLELEMAKRQYKEAYEAGDAEQIIEAQTKLSEANYRVQKVNDYKPALQQPENDVNIEASTQVEVPRPDQKTLAWQERNPWWGVDEEMTALALGYHQKLEKQYGRQYVGTDEYWQNIDKTMKRRFPDYFGEEEVETSDGGGKPVQRTETKPATVVAPASRSTSSKKIVLTKSEVNLAKKFGLTPEQYAKEKQRLEKQNG